MGTEFITAVETTATAAKTDMGTIAVAMFALVLTVVVYRYIRRITG